MSRSIVFFLGICLAASAAHASEKPRLTDGGDSVIHGGLVNAGRAARDTTYLLGGPGRLDGKFQNQYGQPSWQGWTHVDRTATTTSNWHIADYQSPTGTLAMWCGRDSFGNGCGAGYGNNWTDDLVFTHTVANPNANTVVNLQFVMNSDSEPGYDYLRVQANRGGAWQDVVAPYDGIHTGVNVITSVTFTPSDYVGPAMNLLQLRLRGVSDDLWSDEDCLYDSQGLAQVDNIHVTISSTIYADNFDDGTSLYWTPTLAAGCGDFAKIWSGLLDIDPCVSNLSPQVAFIDDGVVVPGTGGAYCITWCYGPGGYIVNNTGGLAGPDAHLDNLILSPVLTWPTGNDGAVLTYDAYAHEDLAANSPGIFYAWYVRSATNPEDLATAPWRDRGFFQHGRGYRSHVELVADLLVPGRTYVQIGLRCVEYGWVYGLEGTDGTPAPYFDNVAFKVFPFEGPSLTARAIDLAQDSFPERGELDFANLANNWVRFDMARTIAPQVRNDPGDSILVDIGLPRAGSVLNDMPKLVVKMKANPLFDAVRVLPANFTWDGEIVDGWVYGDSTFGANGTPIANRYNFDLPDSNFVFPGDVLHYYIEVQDNLNGDVRTATVPADLTFLPDFRFADTYPGEFTVRALPSVETVDGHQPRVLFWNDAAGGGGDDLWYEAFLRNYYVTPGEWFDVYETNGPSSGVGNGLGGRATGDLLSGYELLVYTCGDLGFNTLGNGDGFFDFSDDIGVLTDWFEQGDKQAFMAGDDLVGTLNGSAGTAFRLAYLGVDLVSGNIAPLIGNQTAPRVQAVAGNSITMPAEAAWVAYGGCPGLNDIDAVTPRAGAERMAQFCDPAGQPDYPYAGMWRYANSADVMALPYDLGFVVESGDWSPPNQVPVRAWLLGRVLFAFGHGLIPIPGVPEAGVLAVTAAPNPFNPRTNIVLYLPRAGEVSLRLYDIRGRLVKTLHDGQLAEGRHDLIWNGDDDTGRAMASGVYFYEAKAVGEERIGKLTLVR